MAEKAKFKTTFERQAVPDNPEALFRDLRVTSSQVKNLWAHQADILRQYHCNHLSSCDVALELPTGAGKTLIGLLIAEYRRRSKGERAVFLCPTKQLANQVRNQAVGYGIRTAALIGPQRNYDTKHFNAYQRAEQIAITTYSGLFNTNPRIDDPQLIVLDDAHAAEQYIAGMWSLEISREEVPRLYLAFLDILAGSLPLHIIEKFRDGSPSPLEANETEMLPGVEFRKWHSALSDLMNGSTLTPEIAFSWMTLSDHLMACNLFISWRGILIRPVIPPTLTHSPFSEAKQRVYMSATLGAGGELERTIGVKSIQRVPIPDGWDKQGIGRRFFLFPEIVTDRMTDAEHTVIECIKRVDRSIILASNNKNLDKHSAKLVKQGYTILSARDIEDSLENFVNQNNVVLTIANRYDGIDLPDESCRLLIMEGLPSSANLQETFLRMRLKALSLLRDRLLTRFTQGVGRSTRSRSDYSAVVLLDASLLNFVHKSENLALLHPELQAELEFGQENSKQQDSNGLLSLLEQFISKDEAWQDAEDAIIQIRSSKTRRSDAIATKLRHAVDAEVDYVYAMWTQNYVRALEKSRTVCDVLDGDAAKGYRGWWYYLSGDCALIQFGIDNDGQMAAVARDQFTRAAQCTLGVSWLSELSRIKIQEVPVGSADITVSRSIESIVNLLESLGHTGPRFDKRVSLLLEQISSDDDRKYQNGLKILGEMLGFESSVPDGNNAPDCVWSIPELMYIAHEAKTQHGREGTIGASDIRQGVAHADWVRGNMRVATSASIHCVIESPRSKICDDAVVLAGGLLWVSPTEIRELAQKTVSALRSIRAEASISPEEGWPDRVQVHMKTNHLLPRDILIMLSKTKVSELPKEKC